MAARGWTTDRPVIQDLFEEPYRFDFYQAVRLLESIAPDRVPVGEDVEPDKEVAAFKSTVAMHFPPSDLAFATPADEDGPPTVTVNFMGLAGAHGPLPAPYTEMILERVWHKDTALRDFLDLFNHRLISHMFRVRRKHRVALGTKPPDETPIARYLFALIGLGTPALRDRMQVKDRALLGFAGLLAQQPRSMIGLEHVLSAYFAVPVRGTQLVGRWYRLEEDQRTTIGRRGRNHVLGESAIVGSEVWDQQGTFRLRVGPLYLHEFLDVLPIGRGFRPLCELTRFYAGQELDFDFVLTMRATDVPPARLSASGTTRLGWTSWLKTREFAHDDSQVRLSPRWTGRVA
ncbi:MAG: type VI secretion system baseplate subunit TssG [Candidatus Rokubacteria bacterium]|nr:type VI secretion system baseplate subunit TssG [Candidatus Rokubacteria bacterium]